MSEVSNLQGRIPGNSYVRKETFNIEILITSRKLTEKLCHQNNKWTYHKDTEGELVQPFHMNIYHIPIEPHTNKLNTAAFYDNTMVQEWQQELVQQHYLPISVTYLPYPSSK